MLRDVEWRSDALLIFLSFGANVTLKIFPIFQKEPQQEHLCQMTKYLIFVRLSEASYCLSNLLLETRATLPGDRIKFCLSLSDIGALGPYI